MEEGASKYFDLMPVVLFNSIYPFVIGIFLRLPKLIIEIKQQKQWTFDWVKFIAIGIPSLYIAMIPILSIYFGMNLLFTKEFLFLLLGSATFTSTAGIVFGYVLLDSLKNNNSSTNGAGL